MQSFIPQQIANKLVLVVCLVFYSTGAGQEHSSNKGCMVGGRCSNAEHTKSLPLFQRHTVRHTAHCELNGKVELPLIDQPHFNQSLQQKNAGSLKWGFNLV